MRAEKHWSSLVIYDSYQGSNCTRKCTNAQIYVHNTFFYFQGNSSQSSQTAPTLTTARYYAGRAPARPIIAAHGTDNSIDWDLLGIDSEDGDSDLDDEKKTEKELAENRLIGKLT